MSYNQNTHIAIGFQNSFDTANVASLYHMQHLEETVSLDIPPLIDQSNKGIFDEGDGYAGPKMIAGDLTINAKAIPLGVLLRGLMGAASVSAVTSLFAHEFKPRTTDFDKFSAGDPLTYLKYNDTGSSDQFYNMNISALEFGVNAGEFLTAKATFVGGTFSQLEDIAASFPTGKRMTWDSSSIQLGGAANGDLKALTININDGIEAMHTFDGTTYPSRNKRTAERTIEVGGTIVFDDQVEYQNFISQAEQSLIACFAGPVDVGSGGPDKIVFDMPAFRYLTFPIEGGGPGKKEVGFTGSAKYLSSSATAIAITLTNTFAVY